MSVQFHWRNLTARPIWRLDQLGNIGEELAAIASNIEVIREEGLAALYSGEDDFSAEAENLREYGLWQQLVLFERGQRLEAGCDLAPKTCEIIEKFMGESAAKCQRGQVKFSVMHPGTHVWPHSG